MADLAELPTIPIEFKAKRRRNITADDFLNIARLVSQKHLTETQACLRLGIKPESFFVAKCKGKNLPKFANILEHAKAMQLESCIDRIDACANGDGMKQPDWRAAAWRAERINPALQANQQANQQPLQQINVSVSLALAQKVYGQASTQVQDSPPLKQVSDKPSE